MKTIGKVQLSRGEKGTDETIAIMTALSHDAAMNSPMVQDLARRLKQDNDSEWNVLKDLYRFLHERVVFSPDRDGAEEIRHPESMLRAIQKEGNVYADCDDRATLAVAILGAMPLPAFFIVMSGAADRGFHHVYYGSSLSVMPERLIPFDPQANTPPGEHTPAFRRKVYKA